MSTAQRILDALARYLAQNPALPDHGALLVDIRDGEAHRVEVKTSVFVRDLTTHRGLGQTPSK